MMEVVGTPGSNLPPGVTESMIPGNRPQDIAYERVVDELGPDDIIEICLENCDSCDHCIISELDGEFLACEKDVTELDDDDELKIMDGADMEDCPYVVRYIEERSETYFEDLAAEAAEQRYELMRDW